MPPRSWIRPPTPPSGRPWSPRGRPGPVTSSASLDGLRILRPGMGTRGMGMLYGPGFQGARLSLTRILSHREIGVRESFKPSLKDTLPSAPPLPALGFPFTTYAPFSQSQRPSRPLPTAHSRSPLPLNAATHLSLAPPSAPKPLGDLALRSATDCRSNTDQLSRPPSASSNPDRKARGEAPARGHRTAGPCH